METTAGRRLTLSRTACKIAAKEGWTAEQIQETFQSPKAVYPNKQREGQFRIAGTDICIIGVPVGDDRFHGITMIVNGSEAPA